MNEQDRKIELQNAIAKAGASWVMADWTHENGRDGDNAPVYCEGSDPSNCDTCRMAEDDAARARLQGARASFYSREGNPTLTVAALREAVKLEAGYGDAPMWRPALVAAEAWLADCD